MSVALLGDDGRELLELREVGRDGYKLNLMLDDFLTLRPRSPRSEAASGALPAWAPSTILAALCPLARLVSISWRSCLVLFLSCTVQSGTVRDDQVRGRGRMAGNGWRRQRWEDGSMLGIGMQELCDTANVFAKA